jgi:hypothetical protein
MCVAARLSCPEDPDRRSGSARQMPRTSAAYVTRRLLTTALSLAFAQAKRLTDRHSPGLEQVALADLIGSGAYERHVRHVRHRNGERCLVLMKEGSGCAMDGSGWSTAGRSG